MPVSSTIAYPAGAKFDMDYYLKNHMPLAQKKWAPVGLKSWKVVSVSHGLEAGALDSTTAPYSVVCLVEWESLDSITAAVTGEEGKEVFGDIPNFSDKAPIFFAGAIVGTS